MTTISVPITSKLMLQQIEKWKAKHNDNVSAGSTINIESTKNEINKLQKQEDRYADAYSKGVLNIKKFEEYVAPIREKISEYENQISKASLEMVPKNEIILPSKSEIEAFAEESIERLKNLGFKAKQAIIRQAVNKITAERLSLQAYGLINLHEIYVFFFTEYRNCRPTKRRKINLI